MKTKISSLEWQIHPQFSMIWLIVLPLPFTVMMKSKRDFWHNFLAAQKKISTKLEEGGGDLTSTFV